MEIVVAYKENIRRARELYLGQLEKEIRLGLEGMEERIKREGRGK